MVNWPDLFATDLFANSYTLPENWICHCQYSLCSAHMICTLFISSVYFEAFCCLLPESELLKQGYTEVCMNIHVDLVLRHFCFKCPLKSTPLLDLLCHVARLTPFGQLLSTTLTHYIRWKYNFSFTPFWYTLTFSGTKVGPKSGPWCIWKVKFFLPVPWWRNGGGGLDVCSSF